jgi:hypothetical protein
MSPALVHSDARLALKVKIDVEGENDRLAREHARLEGRVTRAAAKLGNANCATCGPEAMVMRITVRPLLAWARAGRQSGEVSETRPSKRLLLPSNAA